MGDIADDIIDRFIFGSSCGRAYVPPRPVCKFCKSPRVHWHVNGDRGWHLVDSKTLKRHDCLHDADKDFGALT